MTNEFQNNPGLALSNAAADAVARAADFTVLVAARRRLPLSGLLLEDGLVLTASHGIEREAAIRIGLPDGQEAQAALVGRDRGTDLAVLRLEGGAAGLSAAQPAAGEARVGSLVLAVGRPSPEGVQASFGLVSAAGAGLRTQHGALLDRYLLTDAVPYPGFSGGPLIDLGGGVLGVNTSGLVRGTSLAIPAAAAWQVARSLAEHGRVRRGYLGIRSQVVELPEQARQALGRDQHSALLVVGVEAEGPSVGALMVGDILAALDGRPVSDHEDLLAAMADAAGREVRVDLLRGGQPASVALRAGER